VVEDAAVKRWKQGQATSPSVSARGSGNGHRMSLRTPDSSTQAFVYCLCRVASGALRYPRLQLPEGLIAIGAGVVAGSIALVGFDLDSLIEVSASAAALCGSAAITMSCHLVVVGWIPGHDSVEEVASRVLGVCRLWCRFTLRNHGIRGRQSGRIARSVIDSQERSRNLSRAWAPDKREVGSSTLPRP
jgi:hypothetical protein